MGDPSKYVIPGFDVPVLAVEIRQIRIKWYHNKGIVLGRAAPAVAQPMLL